MGAHQLLQWKHKLVCLDLVRKNGKPVGEDDKSGTTMISGDFGFSTEKESYCYSKTCYFGKEEMRCFRHFLFIKTNLFRRFSVPFMSSAAQLQSGQYVCTKMKRGIKIFLYLHCKFLTRVSKCNYL